MKLAICAVVLALLAGCGGSTYVPSAWLSLVPAAERAGRNPLPQTAANVHAGGETYGLYCANCHSADGLGRRNKPSLRSARVRGETDGEIHWILVNGSKNHGMPAWKLLGDDALWQTIEYVRAMPPDLSK